MKLVDVGNEHYPKPVILFDADDRAADFDPLSHGIITVDFEHHEVHEGDHFFWSDSVELDSTEAQVYLFTTPNTPKWIHLTFQATGNAITQVDLYEGADRTGTNLQTTFNSNRNSSKTPGLVVHKNISAGSTDGTLILTMKSGSATNQSRSSMTSERSHEIILRANTKYLLRITSSTNVNLTNLQMQWYEHISKT